MLLDVMRKDLKCQWTPNDAPKPRSPTTAILDAGGQNFKHGLFLSDLTILSVFYSFSVYEPLQPTGKHWCHGISGRLWVAIAEGPGTASEVAIERKF
jgi:hypothetical protein